MQISNRRRRGRRKRKQMKRGWRRGRKIRVSKLRLWNSLERSTLNSYELDNGVITV